MEEANAGQVTGVVQSKRPGRQTSCGLLEEQETKWYAQIGRLTTQVNWLKKNLGSSLSKSRSPGAGLRHRATASAQRPFDCQPQHAHLCAHQPARLAACERETPPIARAMSGEPFEQLPERGPVPSLFGTLWMGGWFGRRAGLSLLVGGSRVNFQPLRT